MMGRFDLKDYVEVKDRIPLFLESHPDGRIVTEILYLDFAATPPTCVIRAELYRDHEATEPMATGLAYERESGMINKTSFVENCETSAVGRALANANFAGTGPRPSREEMEKVERAEAELDQMVDRVRSLYADETGKARQAADAAIRERNFSRLQAAIKHKEKQA
jgi:hypothetical protein